MTGTPAAAVTMPETANPAPLPLPAHRTRNGLANRDRSLVLGAIGTAPRTARATLHECLSQWKLGHLEDDAANILSELVANAVTASQEAVLPGEEAAAITVAISADDSELWLRAWDPDPLPPPVDYTPGTWDESGRGLIIIKALAHRWGTIPGANGGKYVYATLRTSTKPAAAKQHEDTP